MSASSYGPFSFDMEPIKFSCKKHLPLSPQEICNEISDLSNWVDFPGYGPLPEIIEAKYEKRTDDMVGSRIAVTNSDESTHVEEILAWDPESGITMKLCEFSAPLSSLADHFLEEWTFAPDENGTLATRSFKLYPTSAITQPFLWIISKFLKGAIEKHLDMMAKQG